MTPVTKKMTFSASSDTSAVIIDNIATVDMVEKLQLVSDKDGNFKLVQHGGAATTDTVLKVSDFTDKKVFESSISNVNGKFEAYLTKSSAASLFVPKGGAGTRPKYCSVHKRRTLLRRHRRHRNDVEELAFRAVVHDADAYMLQ